MIESVLGFAAFLAIGWWALNAAIRFSLRPARIPERSNPQALGLAFSVVSIPTANGKRLHSWLIKAADEAPALVVLHGWGGNAEMMLPLALPLHRAGYTLLFIDARNHGASDGDTFSSLPRFAEDFEHALDWLRRQPGGGHRRLGVIGHSVGAGAALLAASRRPDIAAVVSLSAFAHPETMMRRWLASKAFPLWPLGSYILAYVQRVIGHRFDQIAPCNTIRSVQCPVLLVHGCRDATVPHQDAMLIHAARAHAAVQLLVLEGGHDEIEDIDETMDHLRRFLVQAMPGASSPVPAQEPATA
ncbi:MAG: alpha/beta fold hydrolase [Rhodocyclaceae bacterium]